MSRLTLGARDRRTLALGAMGIGSLLLVTRGLPAWRAWVTETRAAAAEQRATAARAEAVVQGAQAMGDSLVARNRRFLALAPTLLAGRTVNAAGATLASLVSGAAAEAGVTLGAVQLRSRDAVPSSTFTRIRVECDVTGDIRGVSRFLLALERGPVRLAVRDLTVTQSDAVGAPDRAEVLHATMAIEGLALAARPSPLDRTTP
jgi:Type II secretion system (T2SS), protein M subtype b